MKFLILPTLLLILLSSSCTVETVFEIHKDGSGEQLISMDASEAMQMFGMLDEGGEKAPRQKEMIEEDIPMEIDLEEEEKKRYDPMSVLSNFKGSENVDTAFNFFDGAPDSIKNHPLGPNLKFISCSVYSNNIEQEMRMNFKIRFNDLEHRWSVLESLSFLYPKEGESQNPMENPDMFFGELDIDLKKGILIVPKEEFENLDLGEDSGGDMDMLSVFGEKIKFRASYILPGKVKSVNYSDAIVNGNKVVIEKSINDWGDGNNAPEIRIKFKKK